MGYSSVHLFFDDLEVGMSWESGGRTVTESDITNFAGFSGDFNPMHVDHAYAANTAFRRPIAHGFGVFSMASGLGIQSPPVRTIALLSVRTWSFVLPVFIGDTIRVRTRVVEKTLRGRGKRGEVVWNRAIVNQEGKTVQEGQVITLVECRPLAKMNLQPAVAQAGVNGII
ncbi:MaoC family dehydratase [Limnoglobus roseus]|uniref:Dehydratase n=1 Tax=Limnoglobus roseus TaxID=2598579 RepID=A0A5C1AFZ0_9BACT|nr:MaoC/PaaZ C-terminal domain-containing protein [Limnoglobus roseus]QEL18349.1 dehydratase [Limnoglobus roseus]